MSPASPAANSEEAGTGQTWFKIWEWLVPLISAAFIVDIADKISLVMKAAQVYVRCALSPHNSMRV